MRVSCSEYRGGDGTFIAQAPHGSITWGNLAIDAGSRHGQGRTYRICGVILQDYEVGGMPSAGMSGKFP